MSGIKIFSYLQALMIEIAVNTFSITTVSGFMIQLME